MKPSGRAAHLSGVRDLSLMAATVDRPRFDDSPLLKGGALLLGAPGGLHLHRANSCLRGPTPVPPIDNSDRGRGPLPSDLDLFPTSGISSSCFVVRTAIAVSSTLLEAAGCPRPPLPPPAFLTTALDML